MADSTLKKIVQLIADGDDAALRRAAVVVSGAVGTSKDRDLVKALRTLLDSEDAELRRAAIEAVGRLGAEEAVPQLVELARHGGPELEAAARAAGRMGARAARAMAKLMGEVLPTLRRRIAAALALGGSQGAVLAAVQALLDPDAGVVEASARSLAQEVPSMTDGQRRALAGQLIDLLRSRADPPLTVTAEAAMLRILAALHDPRAEEVFWECLGPTRPAALRAAALQGLGSLPAPSADGKLLHQLMACAAAPEFQVVAPALLILRQVPVAKKDLKHWLKLLEAPDVATKRFAVEKLREVESAEVARALLPQLRHPDRGLREAALESLRASKAGRQGLFDALLEAEHADAAWSLARAQADAAAALTAAQRARLLELAFEYQDNEDRRADALWFLLREGDPEQTKADLQARAEALRKKKDYGRALAYLRMLTRDVACGPVLRFEQAAVGLKLSPRDTATVAREADPCLAQFTRLLQDPNFDALAAVSKVKWLDEEDLYYLGFHFAGERLQAKEFGKGVLELLIKRSPRSQLAKDAKRKLRSEALA